METLANGRVTLHCGDCLDVLATLPENSVDSVCTDPPYHLTSIVKRFGKEGSAPAKGGVYGRSSTGFMGKQWDGGDVAFRPETWAAVYRVLKPGGHLLAFSGTRTYHHMASAIAEAGFDVRDMIAWMYATGFPKSKNVGGGWGSALKPALEPICLARKPLIGTIAENVIAHGTGALNIDGCRVGTGGDKGQWPVTERRKTHDIIGNFAEHATTDTTKGRWPANVVHDGSPEVVAAFPDAPGQQYATGPQYERSQNNVTFKISGVSAAQPRGDSGSAARFFASFNGRDGEASAERRYTDEGATSFSALPGARRDKEPPARFFYTAKADGDDRLGSKHPTVKPLDLMQYLVRLVTPKGGVVLDPFAGTGTTGEAAFREGMRAVLIEREPEYQADIRRRMSLVLGGPDERKYASLKAKGKVEDAGPLFAGLDEAA